MMRALCHKRNDRQIPFLNRKNLLKKLIFKLIQLDTSRYHKQISAQTHLEKNRFKEFAALVEALEKDQSTLLGNSSLFQIYLSLSGTPEGDIVEIGTYKGGGAVFLKRVASLLRRNSTVIAFDTFAGHPHVLPGVDLHEVGQFSVDSKAVMDYLSKNGVEFIEGDIIQTLPIHLSNRKVSFVHLDVDLYEPTKFVLDHMYNFLVPLAVLVVDDYLKDTCPGIERAVLEFMSKNRENFYLFPRPENNQALILRMR